MTQACAHPFMSESSKVYRHLAEATTAFAGKKNPVELPFVSKDKIDSTFGYVITRGGYGTIHKVYDCNRVYKVIPLDEFNDGDEICISKIASDIGVAPTFYSAFIVQARTNRFVFLEMDDADKSLGKLMEEWADRSKLNQFTFGPWDRSTKCLLPLEDAVVRIYGSQETFYFELFSKIKLLAENNISYTDSNSGNIMPNYGTDKGFQLIDFDAATITLDTHTAASNAINSNYNQAHLNKFKRLSNLSEKSVELIRWFEKG